MKHLQRVYFLLLVVCFFLLLLTWDVYVPRKKIRCTTPECYDDAMKGIPLPERNETFVSPLTHVKGIMLGGVQRSGVDLLRTMLNAHPQVDCSREISLAKWKDQDMTNEAVLYDMAKAIGEQIAEAEPVCIKTDFDYIQVMCKILPNVKVIVVIRDGRAVAHSMVTHDKVMEDFDTALNYWSKSSSNMLNQCYKLGSEMCMIMIYEKLVEDTKVWMKATLNFAGLPWSPDVLNHSKTTKAEYYEK